MIFCKLPMVVAQAKERKRSKYLYLSTNHIFTPVAIEISDILGPDSKNFIRDLAHKLEQVTGDSNSPHYLFQQLSIPVQWGNSASILGSSSPAHLDESFVFVSQLLGTMKNTHIKNHAKTFPAIP